MPSFDLVSRLDMGELKNAIDQASREISSRYDFKGSDTKLELKDEFIELHSVDDYKMKAALDILRTKMVKRGLGMKCVDPGDIATSGNQRMKQILTLRNGIDKEQGKVINKIVKSSGLKLTSSYMDEKVRVTGKKIDDLQALFVMVKEDKDVKVDIQMENMKR